MRNVETSLVALYEWWATRIASARNDGTIFSVPISSYSNATADHVPFDTTGLDAPGTVS